MPYEAYEGLNSEKLENCRESMGPDMDMTDTEQISGCRHWILFSLCYQCMLIRSMCPIK